MVLLGFTEIVPVVLTVPHPPVKVTVYVYGDPTEIDGVPEIVTVLADQIPLTPDGSPENVAPVAPVVLQVILVIGEFKLTVCALVPNADDKLIVLLGLTEIVPVVLTVPQPPVKVIVQVNGDPTETDGVPEIVTVLADQTPLTPKGSPENVAPIAPVVL